jgi:hypothetical protein
VSEEVRVHSGTTGRTGRNEPSVEAPAVAGRRSFGRRFPGRGRAVPALLAGALAVAAVALSGCANPQYRFISSSKRDVVVRVPWDWSRLDSEDVRKFGQSEEEAAQQQIPAGLWSAYFDGAKKPAVGHVVGTDLSAPVVVLQSADLPEAARDTITTDQLRDVFLPVSEASRAEREVAATNASAKVPEFRLLSDTPVNTKTARGVHVVFAYKESDGHEEVYDQVAVTDVKRTRWHVLFVHCSTQCYESRKSQFGDITDSFTIKAK